MVQLWLFASMSDRSPQPQDKFVVRLPDGMRDRIKAAAEANTRSMNAEIVATLETAYPAPKYDAGAALREMIQIMNSLIDGRVSPEKDASARQRLNEIASEFQAAMGCHPIEYPDRFA